MPHHNRARLADIHSQNLDHKKKYTKTGNDGFLVDSFSKKVLSTKKHDDLEKSKDDTETNVLDLSQVEKKQTKQETFTTSSFAKTIEDSLMVEDKIKEESTDSTDAEKPSKNNKKKKKSNSA